MRVAERQVEMRAPIASDWTCERIRSSSALIDMLVGSFFTDGIFRRMRGSTTIPRSCTRSKKAASHSMASSFWRRWTCPSA